MQKLGEREPQGAGSSLVAAPSLAVQFFLIPLAVVAVVVSIYGGFRMMVSEERSPEEYLNEIRSGGRDRRWPAAYELSRLLGDPEIEERFPGLAPALVQTFVGSAGDDPRVRRYLALAIGRLKSPPPDAVGRLAEALDDPDTETLISIIWALGSLGDESVVPRVVGMYQSQDAGVRKMAVYALGVLPDDGTHTTLRAALDDPVADVQWNAAVALARHGDDRGARVLARMLDRDYVAARVTASETLNDPASEVMVSGLRASGALGADEGDDVWMRIQTLADADESLRVRQAALETLEALGAEAVSSSLAGRR